MGDNVKQDKKGFKTEWPRYTTWGESARPKEPRLGEVVRITHAYKIDGETVAHYETWDGNEWVKYNPPMVGSTLPRELDPGVEYVDEDRESVEVPVNGLDARDRLRNRRVALDVAGRVLNYDITKVSGDIGDGGLAERIADSIKQVAHLLEQDLNRPR